MTCAYESLTKEKFGELFVAVAVLLWLQEDHHEIGHISQRVSVLVHLPVQYGHHLALCGDKSWYFLPPTKVFITLNLQKLV